MKILRSGASACAVLACALLLAPSETRATTVKRHLSIVDLLQQSEVIVRGRVKSVTDGVDARGIPYTEVTLVVAESLKGKVGGEYTFRQFGLLAPKRMENGLVNLMVTPSAWSTYARGEESIYFLRKAAAWTGLRTTAGLAQGKFQVSVAGATNSVDNTGLFERVTVDPGLLGDGEQRVMATTRGAVNAKSFTSLVKQAVEGKWVENGRMRHVDR
jgi:hypothetical protein